MAGPTTLARPDGEVIAYHARAGKSPGVLFCGGFKSDMTGTKAMALDAACAASGRAFVRFDYLGHGASSGDFRAGTIGRWRDDTLAALDELTRGPQIVVGSSMGGWLALLAAIARPERVKALVLVAPAPDFTEALMWATMTPAQRETLLRDGVLLEPSDYADEPYAITLKLIEEGRRHLILDAGIPFAGPVRILHGMKDADVPWRHSLRLIEALHTADVKLQLYKTGDHRLSGPTELADLCAAVEGLAAGL